ncbi:hypothetical protein LSUE1_G004195 [Lachnellula suecica]|uniref:Uncharacterized protein n=1 Tax=Lachnellula suecica TaxID=602035 RepID=A0A8T9C7U5_9HELO|nr:hypothetical protein LSUE1_G004195 [Lachnellula suecica]
MSTSQSLKSSAGQHSDPMYAACHQRHHIEFLLVLKQIKPCALFAAYGPAQEVFTEMVKQCLKPVFKQHKLARYGFHLQQITHPVPTTVHSGFQDGWIFADMKSALWPEVNSLFLTPNKGKADEKRVGKALGYPVVHGPREFRAVDYTEMDDMRKATGREVCCVSAYEFTCASGSKHYQPVILNFERCRKAAEDVGTNIRLDLEEYEELEMWMEQRR